MDENYPIDIHYNKLLDWLVNRRHCDAKWHVQSKALRSRVATAIKALPQDNAELAQITQEQDRLHYFDCKEILEVLKKVDGETKSLFGQYTAPRVKEWADLVKGYEQGNVYLAECGQQLARMVNYEIPTVKHQISRCQQIVRDTLRQEEELRVSAAALKEKYEADCAEMGIKGVNVHAELSQLIGELPEVYERVLTALPSLMQPLTHYLAFLQAAGSERNGEQFLPMLSYLLKNGNVTVYQWKHGEPPDLSTTQNGSVPVCNGTGTEEGGIDWSSLDVPGTVSRQDDGIDFGDIDFGEMEVVEEDLSAIITLEDSGEGEGVASSGEGGVVSSGEVKTPVEYSATELQVLLESPATRNLFLDDLMELKEFLTHRIQELNSDHASTQMLYDEDFGLQSGNSEDMATMLGHVTTVLDQMTNKKVQHLFLMKGSQRYLQRLSEKLLQNLRLSNRASSQALEREGRREQASVMATNLQPQYQHLINRTKALQKQMAAEISQRYKNRTVNIMGEINQI